MVSDEYIFTVLTYYINPKGKVIAHCWGTYPTRARALTVKREIDRSHSSNSYDPVPVGGSLDCRVIRIWNEHSGA